MMRLLGRVRGPGVLSVRARRKLGGGWGALLLARAAHRWVASTYQGNGPWVDLNGDLVAWKGAAGQAAIIDAGLVLPGVGGNYASTSHSLVTATTSVVLTVTGIWGDADANASFLGSQDANSGFNIFQESDQDIRAHFYDATASLVSGSVNLTAATHGFTDGDPFAMRFTVDVVAEELVIEHGSSLASMTTESAVTLSTIGGGGLFDGAASALVVGMRGTGSTYPGVGTVGTAAFSFDGTVVASPDFATETPGALTHTDAQANVWAVTQTADGSDDPVMEPEPDTGHVSFPLTADNTISTPKQGGWTTVEWEAFFSDATSETGTTAADPVVVGGTGITKSAVERVELHDGIGGATVADLDIARDFDGDHNTLTSIATGEVWTVNRSTLAVGYRTSIVTAAKPRYGGAQYLRFAPPSLFTTDAWTIVALFRSHAQTAAGDGLIRMNSTGSGYIDMYLTSDADMVRVRRDGDSTGPDVANVDSVSVHDGALHVAVARWDGVSLTMTVDSTDDQDIDSSIASDTIAAFDIGYIGSLSSGSSALNGEDLAPLFYGTVLTDDEVNALCTQLGAGT
ncbi:MAG: LamG domain-containing protein [Actinomycetia bacterium]|nr:LamG domain-containing protein [Actinomycetes bacterium]